MKIISLELYWKKLQLPFLINTCCFLYLLRFTWLKWGDLIIDTGREAYVPLALISGKLLYRDIFYLYGPFPPYFNAFLFKIFGPHINTLVLSGLMVTSLCSILIYKISRVFLNTFAATLVTLTFLLVFAFGDYFYTGIFNFILPYSYPATYGILFSLAAMYSFYLWLSKKSKIVVYLCPLLSVLTFICRIEIGVAVLLAFIIGLCAYSNKKNIIRHLLIFIVAPIFFASMVYYLFFILSKGVLGKSNLLDVFFSNISANSLFTKRLFGGSNILQSSIAIGQSILYYIVLFLFFILGGFLINCLKLKKFFIKWIVVCLIGAVTLSVAYIFVKRFFAYHLQYRMLPFICLGMALGVFQKQVNHKKNIDHVFIAVLSAFSFFLMSRVLFFAWAGQYGFYILTPALIVYYTFFLKTIPGFIKLNSVRIFFTVCFMALSIFFIINHFSISKYFYQNKTLKIFSLAGNINIFNNTRDYRVKELIEFLAENTNEKDTLAVFPEGILINFLSKRENPLYYYQYLPLDLVRESVEDGIIKDMKNKKIDYVVINQRNTSEYGYIAFGYDYGKKISNYIINNYDFYKQFGSFQSAGQDYGIVVFKRKI